MLYASISEVVNLALFHISNTALGTKRRETRVSLFFFCCCMYGWQKREHEVFRKEEAHAP